MPLLQTPFTKRMAASDKSIVIAASGTARLDVVFYETNSMPLLQIALVVTAVVKSLAPVFNQVWRSWR
jgi:hypothetical protein